MKKKLVLFISLFTILFVGFATVMPQEVDARVRSRSSFRPSSRSSFKPKSHSTPKSTPKKSPASRGGTSSNKSTPKSNNTTKKSPASRGNSNIKSDNKSKSVEKQSPAKRDEVGTMHDADPNSVKSNKNNSNSQPKVKAPIDTKSSAKDADIIKDIDNRTKSKNLGSSSDYLRNPYRSNGFFNTFVPYYLLFGNHNHYSQARTPSEDTYWIIIKDNKGEEQAVLVTKSQYDQIKVEDELTVENDQLFINGRLIKE